MAKQTAQPVALQEHMNALSGQLLETIRAVVQAETSAVETRLAAKLNAAPVAGDSQEFKNEVNACMEKAFQTVLPQLIKRFKEEIDERLKEVVGSSVAASGLDLGSLANSDELKEMLDGRFRQMMLYLKQDIIPKVVESKLATA